MTAALAEVATGIAAHPAARELADGAEAARSPVRPAGGRARYEPASRRHRGHRLRRRSRRSPRLERTPFRHPTGTHRRSPRPVRDALGARPAPGARPAHRQRRECRWSCGRGRWEFRRRKRAAAWRRGRRARAVAGGRGGGDRARRRFVSDIDCAGVAPHAIGGRGRAAARRRIPAADACRARRSSKASWRWRTAEGARELAANRDRLGHRDPRRDPVAPDRAAARRARPCERAEAGGT